MKVQNVWRRSFLTAVIVFFCILSAYGLQVRAAEETLKEGEWEYIILDDGTVEITLWKETTADLVIPESIAGKTVTSLGYTSIAGGQTLKSVVIPDTVTNIEDCAFYANTNCASITIPASVTSIGRDAFYMTKWQDDYLSEHDFLVVNGILVAARWMSGEVVIPDGVTTIIQRVFYGFKNITSVVIPDGVVSIGGYAFAHCTSLNSVTIPASVTEIDYNVFVDTPWLAQKQAENPLVIVNDILIDGKTASGVVNVPQGVKKIAAQAFCDNKSITGVTLPSGLTYIGDSAFCRCSGLSGELVFPRSMRIIEFGAFANCSNLTGEVVIPYGVTYIENNAFVGCSKITRMVIPETVQYMGEHVFYNAKKIELEVMKGSYAEQYAARYVQPYRYHSHTPGAGAVLIDATCTKDGKIDYECSVCYAHVTDTPKATKDISSCALTLEQSSYEYTGSRQEPKVTLKDGSTVISSSYYTVSYSNNINAGTATVTVTGANGYSGTVSGQFTIKEKRAEEDKKDNGTDTGKDTDKDKEGATGNISNGTLTLSRTSYTYNGKERRPTVTVKNGSKVVDSRYYTVSYSNNKNAGKATVTVTGRNGYSGSLKKTFTIKKAAQTITAKESSYKKVYGNKDFSMKAKAKTSLSYKSSNKKVVQVNKKGNVEIQGCGKATITITAKGTGNYKSATKKVTVTVVPKKTTIVSATGKEKAIIVKWKKQTKKTTGYQIQYAQNKNFKNAKVVSIKKNTTTGKTITNLKSKKTYYVRIRTYTKVNGKNYYSTWSEVKKVKTK